MTQEKVGPALQKALGINIEKLAETAGTNEHNLREEWEALTRKTAEFGSKYVDKTDPAAAS